jgi:hypothetical protein
MENWQEKPDYAEKNVPNATLTTTNPTWPDWDITRAAASGGTVLLNRQGAGVKSYPRNRPWRPIGL